MSGSVNATGQSDTGWLSGLIANAGTVRQKLETLTNQATTGLISSTYAGLGVGTTVSLDLNPEIANMQTWQNNISQASGSMQVTQTTMTQLQSIASSFYSQVNSLNSIQWVERERDRRLGAERACSRWLGCSIRPTGTPTYSAARTRPIRRCPVRTRFFSSGFYTQINTAVGNLATNGAAATTASILATASSNAAGTSPFSAYMSQPAATLVAGAPVVQVGQDQMVQTGLLASANSAVTSTGSSTTGSYMRDLMGALATIGSLSSSQIGTSGFQSLVQSTGASLQGVVSAMAGDAGVLGDTQAALTATQTQLGATSTALTTQVSGAQNVDMAQTLSNLTLAQTQLQASYQVIAGMSALSLVKFLPV